MTTQKKKTRSKRKTKTKPKRREVRSLGMTPEELSYALNEQPEQPKRRPGGPIAASKMTPEKKVTFIKALADSGNVSESCGIAVVSRDCVYRLRKKDPKFAQEWDDAVVIAVDALESEARRRAKDGWLEPVHWQGVPMSVVRKYSDTLLIFLLKGANPEKYRERFDVAARQKIENEPTVIFYPSNGREIVDGDKQKTKSIGCDGARVIDDNIFCSDARQSNDTTKKVGKQ